MATYTLTGKKYADKLAEAKARKYQEIKNDFENEKTNGYMYSNTLSAKVDSKIEDVITLTNLIEYMENNSVAETEFRTYQNTFITTTLSQLKDLKNEMQQHGVSIHQKKWELENRVANATSIETVEGISW